VRPGRKCGRAGRCLEEERRAYLVEAPGEVGPLQVPARGRRRGIHFEAGRRGERWRVATGTSVGRCVGEESSLGNRSRPFV
jgi:hypothetical protein